MKIDDLITQLQNIRKDKGNIDVYYGEHISYKNENKTYSLYVDVFGDCELGDCVVMHDGTFEYEGIIAF